MKKNLFFGFLILFVLSTTAFAGLSDPKKENEKPAVSRENKLSDEEISRMNKRAEIDNLSGSNLLNKEKSSSKDLKATKQVIVEGGNHRHGSYYMYGGGLLLVIILVIILV
jgi:D-lyxose ketol-isomerase